MGKNRFQSKTNAGKVAKVRYFISTLLQQISPSIVKNHCESVRIPIWKLHVLCKKVSAFQKKYKSENQSSETQKHIFKVNFQFWVLSCIAIGKIVFFSKSWDIFTQRYVLTYFFFEIHNPNKKWLEVSVFENSIIRWVYKVVKEALKKSEKIHVVFF